MNEGTILSRSFFFDRSTRERIFSFKRKKGRKKMYFQKLGNDGGRSLSCGDLKRSFETWRNTNRGSRYNRGTRRSMNKYVRYKRWLRRVEKHALRFRNLIETRYFDRGSGWKLIESRKRWNYFSLPPSSNDETKKVKSIGVIRCLSNSKHRVRGISSEAYVISRNLVSRENDSHFIANVLFADESDQFLFGGMKTSVACENEFH